MYSKELKNVTIGQHQLNISDDVFGEVASGVYFYKIAGETENISRKMVLLK